MKSVPTLNTSAAIAATGNTADRGVRQGCRSPRDNVLGTQRGN